MIPAQDDRLLPQMNAALARDTWLASGSLQGFRSFQLLYTATDPATAKAFRIPNGPTDKDHLADSIWWSFEDPDTDVVRSPVANDSFDRYYRASPSQGPMYNTRARIASGAADYVLGIPAPETAPTVAAVGGSGATEARSYVYTWVSAYGEEGPPSPPTTLLTGKIDSTFNIGMTAPLSGDTTNRNLTRVRIYRTITTSAGTAAFFFVAEQAITTLTYADVITDVVASANNILSSTGYTSPPSDLAGMLSMPNGMIAGWRGNEIWFCEPYLPHAWPVAYTLSVDFLIVGLGVVGQTLVVLTEGYPYAASGINPSSMALSKIATHEPCMSRGSIVPTASGVLYASPNGLVIAAFGVVENASVNLVTKDKWQTLLGVNTIRAAQLGTNYYCFGSVVPGCFEPTAFDVGSFEETDFTDAFTGALISLLDQRVAWTTTTTDEPISSIYTDEWSGEVLLCRGGQVFWFDISSEDRDRSYLWRSKIFQTPDLRNMAAAKVWFSTNEFTPAQNPVRNVDPDMTLGAGMYGILRLYADGVLRMSREIRSSGELLREPTGYKGAYWQFELECQGIQVNSLEVATTVKELLQV